MKKLLVGLLVLSSFSVFSQENNQNKTVILGPGESIVKEIEERVSRQNYNITFVGVSCQSLSGQHQTISLQRQQREIVDYDERTTYSISENIKNNVIMAKFNEEHLVDGTMYICKSIKDSIDAADTSISNEEEARNLGTMNLDDLASRRDIFIVKAKLKREGPVYGARCNQSVLSKALKKCGRSSYKSCEGLGVKEFSYYKKRLFSNKFDLHLTCVGVVQGKH
jgi:hypothetical protein